MTSTHDVRELLAPFCAPQWDPRKVIRAPFYFQDRVIGTDGKILLAFPTECHKADTPLAPDISKILPPFDQDIPEDWKAPPPPADITHDNGEVIYCDICNGQGTLRKTDNHEAGPCPECNATGIDKDERVTEWCGAPFAYPLFLIVASLPDVRLSTTPKPLATVSAWLFSCAGDGRGAIVERTGATP